MINSIGVAAFKQQWDFFALSTGFYQRLFSSTQPENDQQNQLCSIQIAVRLLCSVNWFLSMSFLFKPIREWSAESALQHVNSRETSLKYFNDNFALSTGFHRGLFSSNLSFPFKSKGEWSRESELQHLVNSSETSFWKWHHYFKNDQPFLVLKRIWLAKSVPIYLPRPTYLDGYSVEKSRKADLRYEAFILYKYGPVVSAIWILCDRGKIHLNFFEVI